MLRAADARRVRERPLGLHYLNADGAMSRRAAASPIETPSGSLIGPFDVKLT